MRRSNLPGCFKMWLPRFLLMSLLVNQQSFPVFTDSTDSDCSHADCRSEPEGGNGQDNARLWAKRMGNGVLKTLQFQALENATTSKFHRNPVFTI